MTRRAYVPAVALVLLSAVSLGFGATSQYGTLATKLPDLKFDNVTFVDAVNFLQEATNANLHVNYKALSDAGIDKNSTVSLRARNVTLRTALKLLTDDLAPGQISVYQEDGIIEVTTKALADQALITRVYDVRDLLLDVPDFTQVQSIQLQQSQRGGIGGGGGGGSNGNASSVFSNQQQTSDSGNGQTYSKAGRAADLVNLITTTIQPDIWRANGGTASITYYNGNLIVTAPRSVHEALAGATD